MSRQSKPSEKEFADAIIEFAHIYGWLCAHFRPAMTSKGWRTPVQADAAGFPDLVLVKPPKIIFAELKIGKGTLTPNQQKWLTTLFDCKSSLNISVQVWFPQDWAKIVEILSGGKAQIQGAIEQAALEEKP